MKNDIVYDRRVQRLVSFARLDAPSYVVSRAAYMVWCADHGGVWRGA